VINAGETPALPVIVEGIFVEQEFFNCADSFSCGIRCFCRISRRENSVDI